MKKIEGKGNELLNKRYEHKGCNFFFNGDKENDLLYHILILSGKKMKMNFMIIH